MNLPDTISITYDGPLNQDFETGLIKLFGEVKYNLVQQGITTQTNEKYLMFKKLIPTS